MAVEMINRRIQFSWNAGGGVQQLTHPLRLLTNTAGVTDDTRWYHITISRVGNVGQLQVVPANSKGSQQTPVEPVRVVATAGFSKMDLVPSDVLWIGGAPDRAMHHLRTKNFAGCLHTVNLDGENVGLWNFTESEGCGACNEGESIVHEHADVIAFGFNGKGYFKGTNRLWRAKPFFSVVLAFKTLDEDALLFLSVNERKNQYFSVFLEDGHIVFIVQFNSQTRLRLKSSQRWNNNEMTQIQVIVQNKAKGGERSGRLVIGDKAQSGVVKGGPDLDLHNEPFYFGGVEPEFAKDRWGSELVLHSLLGCLSGLSVLDEGKNPHTDGQYYGIESSCIEKPLSEVGFLGQGFVELTSQVLRRDSNFGFTFQTMEADALLMVSTYVGQDDWDEGTLPLITSSLVRTPLPVGGSHPPDFYSVSIVEGHLEVQMNGGGGGGVVRLMSLDRFNDGRPHALFVIKENRKIILKVDDREVNSTKLDRGSSVVSGPETGGLYFGGVPGGLDIVGMVGSSRPLLGCIRDVIVNNDLIHFSRPVQFKDVYIGRCGDLPQTAIQGMEGDAEEVSSCRSPSQHMIEYKAIKFGDQLESYAVVSLEREIFRKDFNISFEFRTVYPDGLFFYASNTHKKQTQRLSVYLRNGQIVATLRRKKKHEIVSTVGMNTGKWRKVIVEKEKKLLRLIVDNQLIGKVKVPRKLNLGREIILGGSPRYQLKTGINQIGNFHGCLKGIQVNGKLHEPSSLQPERIVGVGQCFANVQPGSYFPGDAFAIYSDEFNVGSMLDLQLEFRTWELNGVLLSVADQRGTGLSLEIANGALILRVKTSKNQSFSARVSLSHKFLLCDNRWHIIHASYIKDSVTLRVDKYPERNGFNGLGDGESSVETNAPLYVGGLPEFGPQGALTSRENFKGCIRNVVLNSERRDWSEMFRLQNVLLNSCPSR